VVDQESMVGDGVWGGVPRLNPSPHQNDFYLKWHVSVK